MTLQERIDELIENGLSSDQIRFAIRVEPITCKSCDNTWVQVYLIGDKVKCPACKDMLDLVKL